MPSVATEPRRVGGIRSSNCAGEATARTKRELIEVALLWHFEQLTDRAHAFVADTDPAVA
ncbi:hypothetical protein ACBR40_20430 [Nonomuraea sp. AD125B]|uniref:hypothetical protein n=1 Tax=Nonomuraea sp. AD125B TaxID=3242897 RepID=UPI003527A325